MKSIGIIPARYGSFRLEGKPLIDLGGKTMIERVYERATHSHLDEVLIATDDDRIYHKAKSFGANVVMTGLHENGTARCVEALVKTTGHYDIMVNIQGDEPFIMPIQINDLLRAFKNPNTEIATLSKKIESLKEITNPNIVKVVFGQDKKALYFSRSPIPFLRDIPQEHWLNKGLFYRHIGLYAFRTDFLLGSYQQLKPSPLEQFEKLEQLRWLENDINIQIVLTQYQSIGIDTAEDVQKALEYLKKHPNE